MFFAASADGSIRQVNLFRQREDKFSRAAMEAVGGAGVSDVIRIDDLDSDASRKRLITVGHVIHLSLSLYSLTSVMKLCREPISTLTMSLTSSMLLAGTTTGLIHIYDVASHQLVRTLSTHKGTSITHLETMFRPPDLVGHVSLTLTGGGMSESKENIVVRPVATFQRIRDAKARDAHDVSLVLPQTTVCRASSFQTVHD